MSFLQLTTTKGFRSYLPRAFARHCCQAPPPRLFEPGTLVMAGEGRIFDLKPPKISSKPRNPQIAELREKYVKFYGFLRPFTGKIRPFYGLGFRYVSGTYFSRRKYVFPEIIKNSLISPISTQKWSIKISKNHMFSTFWHNWLIQTCMKS